MNDKLILKGIEIFGHYGCTVEEQMQGQIITVDLEMFLDLSTSGKSDDIEDTVDYSKILCDTEKVVAEKSHKLIETAAENVADKILSDYKKIDAIKVTLHKPAVECSVKYAGATVEIFRKR